MLINITSICRHRAAFRPDDRKLASGEGLDTFFFSQGCSYSAMLDFGCALKISYLDSILYITSGCHVPLIRLGQQLGVYCSLAGFYGKLLSHTLHDCYKVFSSASFLQWALTLKQCRWLAHIANDIVVVTTIVLTSYYATDIFRNCLLLHL